VGGFVFSAGPSGRPAIARMRDTRYCIPLPPRQRGAWQLTDLGPSGESHTPPSSWAPTSNISTSHWRLTHVSLRLSLHTRDQSPPADASHAPSSSSSGSRAPRMRPITSSSSCFPVRSSQCSPLPLPSTAMSRLQPFSRHARARPRTVRASESRKRPRFARLIAASNADTESVCCPSATWHRPSTRPARTFEAALKLKLSCISACANLQFDRKISECSAHVCRI
jgi:hypothetical protein